MFRHPFYRIAIDYYIYQASFFFYHSCHHPKTWIISVINRSIIQFGSAAFCWFCRLFSTWLIWLSINLKNFRKHVRFGGKLKTLVWFDERNIKSVFVLYIIFPFFCWGKHTNMVHVMRTAIDFSNMFPKLDCICRIPAWTILLEITGVGNLSNNINAEFLIWTI